MTWDCWTNIEEKLRSAERHLEQASRDIINPELPPQLIAAQFTGVDVSDPQWRAKLSSHVSAFLVDCRSVPDIIRSCFGVDPKQSLATLLPDEQRRRKRFQKSLKYKSFVRLPLSRARVDTVHGQGFADIWVKVGKRYCPLQELDDVEMKRVLAGSAPALQSAATVPPQRVPTNHFCAAHRALRYGIFRGDMSARIGRNRCETQARHLQKQRIRLEENKEPEVFAEH